MNYLNDFAPREHLVLLLAVSMASVILLRKVSRCLKKYLPRIWP
ncbi:hypothetical protein [Pontibacter beigongshangensis]|nr:hypothetical protein [Pontibacter beigongshangensis]